MKRLILLISLLPSLALANGLHGNQVQLTSGVFLGDNSIDLADSQFKFKDDGLYNFGVKANYFLNENYYLIGGVSLETANYKLDPNPELFEKASASVFTVEVGIGYEMTFQSEMALFSEVEVSIGGGSAKTKLRGDTITASTDYTVAGTTSVFGIRGNSNPFLWELGAGFRFLSASYEGNDISDESSFTVALKAGAGYKINDHFSVGSDFFTTLESHLLNANLTYHF